MIKLPDIDIDFADRDAALKTLSHIPASRYDENNKKLVKHNVGVYFQDIPKETISGLSAIPYKEAENRGYFKIDFLNLDLYKGIRDNDHLEELVNREPRWELLENEEFVSYLNQIHSHYNVVSRYKPKSVEELAMVIALIRPGKKHLIGKTFKEIEVEIWRKTDQFDFKRSHSIAYAISIVVQMNLLLEEANETVKKEFVS